MGDEVTLIPGMRLKVSRLYDDAWYVPPQINLNLINSLTSFRYS